MKILIAIVINIILWYPVQAQLLPKCLVQKMAVGYNYSQVRIALYKNDTCYVIDRRTWNPSTTSRQEIFKITSNRKLPDYIQPEVLYKSCKPLKFLRNDQLSFTTKVYSWEEIKSRMKTLKK